MKFGGTSVGSAKRMKEVAQIICDGDKNLVVLSAMSGTTNQLVEIADYLYKKNPTGAMELINKLEMSYYPVVDELYSTKEYKEKGNDLISSFFEFLRSFTNLSDTFTIFEEKIILAQGELISTNLFNNYLNEIGKRAVLLPALEFAKTDKNGEPDTMFIQEELNKKIAENKSAEIFVTQGYICRNFYGEIDNLQRGGSDYSA